MELLAAPWITALIQVVVFLVGGIWFIVSMRAELRILTSVVSAHGVKIDKLEGVITSLAVQDQRLNDLDRRIEELRHWRGFISPNGEYDRHGKVIPKS
jgi:hypothetical protein